MFVQSTTQQEPSLIANPTLYVLIGVAGSGKSTYASKLVPNTKLSIVSTDAIRKMLYGDESDQTNGSKVFDLAYKTINFELRKKKDVVFDATNTTKKGRQMLLRAIRVPCHKVAVLVTPPLEVSIAQNAKRERIVPEEVIRRQYNQLLDGGESILSQFDDIIFVK